MSNFELNKQLYDLLTAKKIDMSRTEELLKLGADPLGSDDERFPEEHIISEVLCYADELTYAEDHAELCEKITDILELFFRYGMDMSSDKNNYVNENDINPMWNLSFNASQSGIKIMKTILDHGIDVDSVEIYIEHTLCDMCLMSFKTLAEMEKWFYYCDIYSIKMIMLAASYSYILDNSEYLRKEVMVERNSYDSGKFRNPDDFDHRIDMSACEAKTGFNNSFVVISEKSTHKDVWKIEL